MHKETFQPGQKFDRYLLKRKLGAGGMGTVFLAENSLRMLVVLKILHPSLANDQRLRERFILEGRIQFSLRHPNIVRVTDIVEDDGVPALVVDYLEGEDLEARLRRGPLSIQEMLEIAIPILDALQLAHEKGYVHRDLKPANVYLSYGERGFAPKLMDFGIAKNVESDAGLTKFQEFYGTPNYASPEQIESTKDVDHVADIYSWGTVIYQMLTGKLPYGEEKEPMKVLLHVISKPFPSLPENFPSWLREVIKKATSYEKADRYKDASHFQRALVAGSASLTSAPFLNSNSFDSNSPSDSSGPSTLDPSTLDPSSSSFPSSYGSYGSKEKSLEVAGESDLFGTEGNLGTRPKVKLSDSIVDLRLSSKNDWEAQQPFHRPDPFASEGSEFDFDQPNYSHKKSKMRTGVSDIFGPSEAIEIIEASQAFTVHHEPQKPAHVLQREQSQAPQPQTPQSQVTQDRSSKEITFARPVGPITSQIDLSQKRSFPFGLVFKTLGVIFVLILGAGVGYYYFFIRPLSVPEGWIRVEPGTFQMGSPSEELGREEDETLHEVTITVPFAIMETEVTRAQWLNQIAEYANPFNSCGNDCPAVSIAWLDAIRFANAMSLIENFELCYVLEEEGYRTSVQWPDGINCLGYRLPTEAEWEYAARGGTTTSTSNGNIIQLGRRIVDPLLDQFAHYGANSAVEYENAITCSDWSNHTFCGPSVVKTKRPNALGLYDMQGNAAEWVWDYYGTFSEHAIDPRGAVNNSTRTRVLRGGSWLDSAENCRLGARTPSPTFSRNNFGFRLVRTLPR